MRPTTAAAVTLLALAANGCGDADARTSTDADTPPGAQPAPTSQPGPAAVQNRAASIDLGFTLGDPEASIAVVEFSDFGCPYCARFARSTFPTVLSEYIEAGTVRWRYVPVVFGFPGGELMGSAAMCAAQQGGADVFWRVHDLFYTRQSALRGSDARPQLLDWVSELGVDRAALDACIDRPATRRVLARHTQAARNWYVRGTPTFVINGVPMAGAVPIDFFRKMFATVQDPSGL